MAYRLELQEVDHRHLVATLLHHLSEELPPDLTLLPTSGPELRTNALALALHSPALTALLATLDRRDGFILSVPASSSSCSPPAWPSGPTGGSWWRCRRPPWCWASGSAAARWAPGGPGQGRVRSLS